MKVDVVHIGFGTFFTVWVGLTLKDVKWDFGLLLVFLIIVMFVLFLLDLGINLSRTDGRRWIHYFSAFFLAFLLCLLSQLWSHPNVDPRESQPTTWLLWLIVFIWIPYAELTKKFNQSDKSKMGEEYDTT